MFKRQLSRTRVHVYTRASVYTIYAICETLNRSDGE